jgi:hypothetical protein
MICRAFNVMTGEECRTRMLWLNGIDGVGHWICQECGQVVDLDPHQRRL